MKVNR